MIPQETPFHDGELAIQDKLGVRQSVASYAPRVIRPYMPDQHREFYAALPYFFIGTVDENGSPWASIVWGEAGFITSPDPLSLTVGNLPLQM
ncbi:MAG: pyridoxamine 5'-phosphate oxidase family protein, partial [Kordiimonas sp.]